ncbi:histidine kinase [Psychroflexus salis]|uniref:Histidine kinase n=1 Tax=Psychroflexus salis TaxID=1526574 RepID=A0A916ZQJ5_9FLAO|nr:histidine kinase [Psychroflexus salis]GGE09223.1 histidine kinase [Psychroflexus salis]
MREFWRDSIIYFGFLLICFHGFAQIYPKKTISIKNGLPSNTVYDIAQDKSGDLWVATEHGLSHLNEAKIINYTENDGLPHNSCWQVEVDDNNTVWTGTFGGGLAYFDGEKFVSINEDDGLTDNSIRKLYYKSPNLYVGTQNGLSIINTNTKQLKTFKEEDARLQVMDFFEFDNKVYFITYNTGSFRIEPNKIKQVNDDKSFFSVMAKNDSLYLSKDGNHRWLNSIHKTSVMDFINNKRNYIDFGGSVFWDFQSIKNKVYGAAWGVNYASGGFYQIADNRLVPLNERYNIESIEIHSMLHLQKTKQLLLATKDKGVQVLDLEHLVSHYPKTNLKSSLTSKDGDVFYSFDDYLEIQLKNKTQILSKKDFIRYMNNEILNNNLESRFPQKKRFRYFSLTQERLENFFNLDKIWEFDGSIYINSKIGIFKIDKQNQGYKISNYYPISSSNGFYLGPKLGLIFQYPYSKVFIFKNPQKPKKIQQFELSDPNSPRDIIKFIKLKDRLFAVSRFAGIYYYEKGKFTSLYQNGSVQEKEFVTARKISDSTLLTTDYRGNIFQLTYNDTLTFKKVLNRSELSGYGISAIDSYGDYIIAVSNTGLNFVNLNTGEKRFLDQEQGFDALNIQDIQVTGHTLILTTPKGLYHINLFKLLENPTKLISIETNSLRVNGNKTELSKVEGIKLRHNQNRFDISLKGDNIKYPKKVDYRYRILGLEHTKWSDWQSWFDNKEIIIPYLPPGDYDIELEYINNYSGQLGCSKIVQFSIKQAFWDTIPFYILYVFLITGLVYIFIRRRYQILNKRQKQKSILEKRIAEAKMEALRSQMNPHFIFNAIGAIQNFVIDNDTDSSLNYMNSFSKLIRKTLDYSSRRTITIKEEIGFLKLFVKIQNLRFGNKVIYTTRVQKNLDKNLVKIPPMLLQPIVENCFEHAFNDKIESPKISIYFTLKNNLIEIKISDNGIGFDNSLKSKSKGLKLIEERLTLIHPENRLIITSNNEGTSVKIILKAY